MELAGIPGSEQLTTIHRETQRRTHTNTQQERKACVIWHEPVRVISLPSLSFPVFCTGITALSNNIGRNKEVVVKKEELIRAGVQKGKYGKCYVMPR